MYKSRKNYSLPYNTTVWSHTLFKLLKHKNILFNKRENLSIQRAMSGKFFFEIGKLNLYFQVSKNLHLIIHFHILNNQMMKMTLDIQLPLVMILYKTSKFDWMPTDIRIEKTSRFLE